MFPTPALFPLVLSKFLTECVTGQFRFLILVAPCWMQGPWISTVLNMLADIPQKCPIIKDLTIDDSVSQVFKGQQLLHLTIGPPRVVLHRQEFSSSVCQAVTGVT